MSDDVHAAAREVYRFADECGDAMSVRRAAGVIPLAIVNCSLAGVHLPPGEVPGAARSLYEAAGLPVPDALRDPVADLAGAIEAAAVDAAVADRIGQEAVRRAMAASLIALGWHR